jgi:hypothetical protein
VYVSLLSFFKISLLTSIFAQDETALDRIKRRNLLNRAQASLAVFFGLGGDRRFASLNFRDALGISLSTQERQQHLIEILTEKKDEIPAMAASLIAKPAALGLLAEVSPKVCCMVIKSLMDIVNGAGMKAQLLIPQCQIRWR